MKDRQGVFERNKWSGSVVCFSLPFVTKGSGVWGKAPRSEKGAELKNKRVKF